MTEWKASWAIGGRGCAGVMLLLLLTLMGCNSSEPSASVRSGSISPSATVIGKPLAAPLTDSSIAAAKAAAERWSIATKLNLPMCVREYGMPDVIDINNHGCGTIIYPIAGWTYIGDWNFPSRATFVYRARGEKIITECGSITGRATLTDLDLWLADQSVMARGGMP